ncbi:MAG: FG-GAP-like repeat-containing protein, partial [candidate division KSB1 bacterium]|nr:FG-GAP-like repeat-containing protein [candidate division KSB1 bacterium]
MRTACRCFSHLLPLLTFLALDCITLQDAPAQSIQFRDVTNETGITPNDPEGYGHGSSFGDFNGDGRPDIYIISYATANFLFRNDGGHFTDIAASAGVQYPSASDRGMAAADYDNDGDLDIYIAAGYTGNVLYHNNGDNTFTDVTDEAGVNLTGQGQGAAWGDYNGDGLLDLFVAQTDGYNVLFRQESDHHFTDVNDAADIGNYSFSLQPVFFDVDNDGDVDLFVARRENQANLLYINNGNGTFRERAAAWGIDSPAPHSQGAAVGDYDRDGDLDVYVCDYDGYNLLYRNQGHYFEEVASWAGVEAGYSGNRGAVFADFNDDGWLDLYVTRRNENKMYQNNGDGTFRNVSGSSGANDWNDGYSPSIADYDNDGDLDIFFTNTGQNSVLLQNQGPFNNWLQIKLIGTTSNSGGVGARLTGWLNGQRQTQTIVAGQAYLCTGSDLTAHFALGSSTHLDSLVIHWPSGIRDRFPNLSANQKLTLIEGTGGGPDTTAPIITGVAADNLTSTTATISWRTDELADSQVEYGLTANYGSTTLLDSNRVNTHAVSLAGLIKNTTYHYRVRSRDAAGNLAVSNDFTFTTLSTDVTPPVILSVFAGNFTSSSATINWTTDEASDSQVEYGLTTSYGNSTALESALVTSHTVSLSGLQASTTYHYRVKSKDAAGNLAVGDDFTFSTLAMSPFQIVLYEIYEVVLTANNPGANPYLNGPAVSVTFTGTSGAALGKSVTIKGFWDGGATYRVRFAPTATGDWSWTSSSSDIGLNGKSGVLTCSGTLPSGHASARGHVHESVMFPYTFVHDDGTPFFLMGDTQWLFSSSDVSWPTEFQTYVEARAAQGFNYVHGQVYAMNPPGVEKNEGGPVFYSNHVDNLNPGFFQILDQRVAYMNSRGIVAGLLLAWADEGWQQFSTPAQVDRYIQYLINRYAAYNVIWITAGEYEEAEPPGGHNHIGEFLKANDPYDHPITTHTINTSADDFGNAAWHTTIYEQTSNPAQITSDRRYHKPVINAEFGYEGRQSADEVRQDA